MVVVLVVLVVGRFGRFGRFSRFGLLAARSQISINHKTKNTLLFFQKIEKRTLQNKVLHAC